MVARLVDKPQEVLKQLPNIYDTDYLNWLFKQ